MFLTAMCALVAAIVGCSNDDASAVTTAGTSNGGTGGGQVTGGAGGQNTGGQNTGGQNTGGAGGAGGAGGSPLVVDLGFCDDTLNVDHGRLCAIQPSSIDPNTQDFFGTASNPGPGFGYHVVAVPQDWNAIAGVWIHFGGTYGSPYTLQSDRYATSVWLDELLANNYLVLQVAYDNARTINGDICAVGSPGYMLDNCAGDVRDEILHGNDVSPEVVVDAANGVIGRLDRLVGHLTSQGLVLPGEIAAGAIDWSKLRVSGHSQGAGHAYYMAKNTGVAFACFLGGPYDVIDAVNPSNPPIADWYKAPGQLTSPQSMGAFVLTTDTNYNSFRGAYGVIGLTENVEWFDADGEYTNGAGEPIDGHAASVGAPALADKRAEACLRDGT